MNVIIEPTHISEIRQGDIIERDGQLITVSAAFIRRCPFMGLSLYGDSYNLGRKLVKRAVVVRCLEGRKTA